MRQKKGTIHIATMSKDDQAKYLTSYIKKRKYMVEVILNGKTKFAYCDDLTDIHEAARDLKLKIVKITEIKHEKRE